MPTGNPGSSMGYPGGPGGYPGGMPGNPGGMPGMMGMPGVTPPPVATGTNPYADLLTDEDVRQDREFTVLLAVVLYDQAPVVPAAPAAGTVQTK